MEEAYDLIVIGGGPAGATLATLVAGCGHRVCLFERQRSPRYQIGESLLPATFNGIFDLLGIEASAEALGEAVLKRGATFHWGRDEALWTLNFGGAPDDTEPGPDWPTAFNVRRDVFDATLLRAARQAGVEVHEGIPVVGIDSDDERVRGVQVRTTDGMRAVGARWVAGADGQASMLAPCVAPRQASGFFRNAALFGYFVGGRRLPPPLAGNVLLESFADGWAWYIPLDDTLTSVGVVLHHPATARLRGDREALFADCLRGCRYIDEYLCDASRATTAPYAGLRVRSEFSYAHKRFWRPGAVLVGDAACFVDVILSSGVHLATFGALQAARAINTDLDGALHERLCMNEFELRYRLEFTKFYQGLVGLHDMRHDGATYRQWLRTMLQRTQGVLLDDHATVESGHRMRTWQAVAHLRRHNAIMVARADAPSMEDAVPVAELAGELGVSEDRLHWLRLTAAEAPDAAAASSRGLLTVIPPLYDYGKLHRSAAPYEMACPDDAEAARAVVSEARARGLAVRVRGSGHTFSGASLPRSREVLLRTHDLDHFRFTRAGRLLVGAGALVWDIRDLVRDHGYDLPVYNGGWAGPTLGGYISAGGFGKSGLSEEAGGLWENIERIRLIDGHGALREFGREDAEFPWLFGSSGQLGLFVEAELRLVPYAEAPRALRYPRGLHGRVPRRQDEDPRDNDRPPGGAGERRLFWFTVLVAPAQEASAWEGLHELVLAHREVLKPDGGWAGPVLDGVPIGYRYVIKFHEFNPPLVYPHAETFLVLGVMSLLASGDEDGDRQIVAIEKDFIDMTLSRGLRLYLQAENVSARVDQRAYYGATTYARFAELKAALDPDGLFNPGVVFRDHAL